MTPEELAAIKARCDAATRGPWAVGRIKEIFPLTPRLKDDERWGCYSTIDDHAFLEGRKEDAEFKAHAREDVPKLVAEVERLRGWLLLVSAGVVQTRALGGEAVPVR